MIPILYEYNETDFTSNGICRLVDTISCKVTEERNGVYECEFEYPISGKHFSDIYEGRIIACTHDDTGDIQPFDIYSHSAPINGVVTFYAHHISYRLGEITLRPFTATSCEAALQAFITYSITANPFTFWTDKAVSGDFTIEEPVTLKAMLGGTSGSILDVYGTGEYEFDKFTVKLHIHRGEDTEVEIRYGKNLADIQEDVDYSDSYTAVVPFWSGQDENQTDVLVHLQNWILSSGHTSYGNRAIVVPMDLSADFEEQPTTSQLQSAAQTRMENSEAWLPNHTIKVDFVQLWQTEEFKDYAPLQRVRLCDTISVYYPQMGITAKNQKVISVEYNVLLERYDSMTIGSAYTRFGDLISSESRRQIEEAAAALRKIINNTNYVLESEMEQAIQDATSLITGGQGGYVQFIYNANGKPEEIVILDNEDINQAQNVWRWNKNGLGFSSTGYNGTYSTAITSSGQIVADFVSTGTLSANLIKAGVLTDAVGNNYWDLTSGEFALKFRYYYFQFAYISTITNYSDYDVQGGNGPVGAALFYRQGSVYSDIVTENGIFLLPQGYGVGSDPPRIVEICESLTDSSVKSIDKAGNGDVWMTWYQKYSSSTATRYVLDRMWTKTKYCIVIRPDGNKTNNTCFSFSSNHLFYASEGIDSVNGRSATNSTSISSMAPLEFRLNATQIALKSSDTRYIVFGGSGNTIRLDSNTSFRYTSSYWQIESSARSGYIAVASSSTRRYKHDIKPVQDEILDPHRLYNLQAKQYVYNGDVPLQYWDMRDQTLCGFIAEDVADIYPSAAIKNYETGQIESWDERRILPPMLELIKEQKQQIDSLEERVAMLEQKLEEILCTLS